MHLHKDSHLDHGLTTEQKAYLLELFGDRDAFFAETVTLPEHLGTVPCALHLDVPEAEVFYAVRGTRTWESRLCRRPSRQVREVTVVAGPHDGFACVLFTAYGGPQAPKEPGDPAGGDAAFWARAALATAELELDWIFTFGASDARNAGRFVKLTGTVDATRERMNALFGSNWSMQYDAMNGRRIVVKHRLVELELDVA